MITPKVFKLTFLFIIALAACTGTDKEIEMISGNEMPQLEFEMPQIQIPQIPNFSVSILDHGAIGDGVYLNTKAFEKAINEVSNKGGGKVIIPSGIWLTGPIILKSNLELHAEEGALIIFSENKDLYPLIETSFEGLNTWRCISPIYGKNLENIAFTGKGIWDGSGQYWRFVKKSKLTDNQWKKLIKSGGVTSENGKSWYPSEQYMKAAESADMNVPIHLKSKDDFMKIRDFLRPVMVSIQNSSKVLFDGPTFQNSPAWCIHPLMVEDLTLQNLTIRNPWYSQNGDGIDIESCKNVLVTKCNLDVGDDAICIKSGKDKQGRDRGIPCENLVITNNIVYHGHGGVTVGSEMSGGVKNMHVSNCTFMGTDVGLRFKSNRGRGGVVENIYISNIRMIDIPTYAISFNMYYGGLSVSEMLRTDENKSPSAAYPVTEETPQFKNIYISDITVKGAMQSILLQGLPEMKLEHVRLKNMNLISQHGISIFDANDLIIENISLLTTKGKGIEIYDASSIEIKNLKYPMEKIGDISIKGASSADINIKLSEKEKLQYILLGDEVNKESIKYY